MTENERIKEIRKEKDLTQTEFGAPIGLKRAAVSMIESGASAVSNQVRLAVCREYGVREEWLRTGEGEKFTPRQTSEELERFFSKVTFETPGFRRALLTVLSRLTDKEWGIVEEKARELAEEMQKNPGQ